VQKLFTTLSVGSMVLRNRLVRSATGEGAADPSTGCPTAAMAGFYGRLAGGGVGLIITGHTAVSPEGRWQAGVAEGARCVSCGRCRTTPEQCNLCGLDA